MGGERLTPAQARRKYHEAFQTFWRAYPRHTNINEAERVFSEILEGTPSLTPVYLIERARAYAKSIDPDDLRWVPAPHKWLQDGKFEDSDLFTDKANAEKAWLNGCWERVDVSAVEARFGIKMPRINVPDGLDVDEVREYYKAQARKWIREQRVRIEDV